MEVIKKVKLTQDENKTLLEASFLLQEIENALDKADAIDVIERNIFKNTARNISKIFNICEH